jgi:ubiquinol oxidase
MMRPSVPKFWSTGHLKMPAGSPADERALEEDLPKVATDDPTKAMEVLPPYGIRHFLANDWVDKLAYGAVKACRVPFDLLFLRRFGHRAVCLEIIAGVPGLVNAAMTHIRCLRRMEPDHGWIQRSLEEMQNERMHLMVFVEIAKPYWFERAAILVAQAGFLALYTLAYLISPRFAHRFVGYQEEEACESYSEYLELVDKGEIPNVPAPPIAIEYWDLPSDATLRDVIIAVRNDEAHHRDVNHAQANELVFRPQVTPYQHSRTPRKDD